MKETQTAHTPGPWKVEQKESAVRGMVELNIVYPGGTMAQGFGLKEVDPFVIATVNTVYFEPHMEEALANASLLASSTEMLKALELAAKLIPIARKYFPKSVLKSDKFTLENTCAAIGAAIHKAKGAR